MSLGHKNCIFILEQISNLDVIDIINDKMDKTEKKYPVNKAKDVATKYNKL